MKKSTQSRINNLCVCVVMEVENVEESVSAVRRMRVGLDPRDESASGLLSIWPSTACPEIVNSSIFRDSCFLFFGKNKKGKKKKKSVRQW